MDKTKLKPKSSESEWDKKKIIFVTVVAVILLFLGFKLLSPIIGNSSQKVYKLSQNASGINPPRIDIKKSVQDQIKALRSEADNLNLVDLATTSPQVKKVINDLRSLKDYPNNQLKQSCVNICSKL